jgi:LuxR family maltose regulon positive regulatory protein
LRRADEEVELGLARLSGLPAHRRYAVRGRLLIYQGYLRSLGMQTEEARKRLKAGIDEARACRDVSLVIGYAVLACLEGQQGQYAGVRPTGRGRAADACVGCAAGLLPVGHHPDQMRTVARPGAVELAAAWLERLGETYSAEQPATPPECHPQLPYYIALWQALLARHEARPDEAERRLRSLIVAATGGGAHLPVLQAQGQLICLLLQDGREEEVGGLLDACLRGAMNGALQPLQVVLQQEPEWLREQLLRRPPCPVQQALLARLPALPERAGACADGLSGRELAVLELIAQGCSNQQISERLYISLHTVKSHARHINDKLGVERRTQAVARAKALGCYVAAAASSAPRYCLASGGHAQVQGLGRRRALRRGRQLALHVGLQCLQYRQQIAQVVAHFGVGVLFGELPDARQ